MKCVCYVYFVVTASEGSFLEDVCSMYVLSRESVHMLEPGSSSSLFEEETPLEVILHTTVYHSCARQVAVCGLCCVPLTTVPACCFRHPSTSLLF